MRDFWDIRFGRTERSDDIDPAAYSRDGYLIHQGKLSGISYGRKTSRETGCGWIACFNFLRFMNRPQPPQEVARRMERMLLWGGCIGSHPLAVWWYLHRSGFRFRVAFTRWGAGRALERTAGRTAGVIAYWHGRGAHFAAFVREEPGAKQKIAKDAAGAAKDKQAEGKLAEVGQALADGTLAAGTDRQSVRFLNAVYGVENHRLTMRDFFQKHVRFPLAMVLIAKERK